MIALLLMSAKLAIPDILEIKLFLSKGYDVITSFHKVTKKILSRDSNYIVAVVMWPKFSNSSISIREVIITSFLQGYGQKNQFYEGWSWFKFNNLGLIKGMALKFYRNLAKGLKLKVRKFWRLIHTFREVTGEKLVGSAFLHPHHPE